MSDEQKDAVIGRAVVITTVDRVRIEARFLLRNRKR